MSVCLNFRPVVITDDSVCVCRVFTQHIHHIPHSHRTVGLLLPSTGQIELSPFHVCKNPCHFFLSAPFDPPWRRSLGKQKMFVCTFVVKVRRLQQPEWTELEKRKKLGNQVEVTGRWVEG